MLRMSDVQRLSCSGAACLNGKPRSKGGSVRNREGLQPKQRGQRGDRPARTVLPDGSKLAAAGGLTLGATLAVGGVAHAATFTVNSLGDPTDPGHTTLHDAITQANAAPDPSNAITFASGLTG